MSRYTIVQLDEVQPVGCPCGIARRAFGTLADSPASVHLVEIKADAETHHHERTTEIYVVLEGEGYLELDGETFPVRPMTAIMIRPGCRHRALGPMKILNIPIPPFDPADEYLD